MKLDIDYTELQAKAIGDALYQLGNQSYNYPGDLPKDDIFKLAQVFMGAFNAMKAMREVKELTAPPSPPETGRTDE